MLYSAAILTALLASSDAFIAKPTRVVASTSYLSATDPWFPASVSTVNIDVNALK
jgi:hypothetical protein